ASHLEETPGEVLISAFRFLDGQYIGVSSIQPVFYPISSSPQRIHIPSRKFHNDKPTWPRYCVGCVVENLRLWRKACGSNEPVRALGGCCRHRWLVNYQHCLHYCCCQLFHWKMVGLAITALKGRKPRSRGLQLRRWLRVPLRTTRTPLFGLQRLQFRRRRSGPPVEEIGVAVQPVPRRVRLRFLRRGRSALRTSL